MHPGWPRHRDPVNGASLRICELLARPRLQSVGGRSTQLLGVCSPLLRLQPALLRASTRGRRPARRRGWSQSIGHDGGQPSARGIPVAQLRSMLGCDDRQHSADEATTQSVENTLALQRREDTRSGRIPREFHAGIRRVHSLSAGAGRPRESPRELGLRDRDARCNPQAGTVGSRHESIMLLRRRGSSERSQSSFTPGCVDSFARAASGSRERWGVAGARALWGRARAVGSRAKPPPRARRPGAHRAATSACGSSSTATASSGWE